MTGVQWLALTGLVLSLYALKVQRKLAKTPDYQPVCDISAKVSCSRAFGSQYGRTLGIPNPLTGTLYYSCMALLPFTGITDGYLLLLSIPALLFSIYLGYVSYFRQRNFCLVCSASYLVNAGITLLLLFPFNWFE